jgi:histidyl-tRNA synthetase
MGERARERALESVQALRRAGLAVSWDPAGHGLGGQMKRAGRSGARFALLVGDDELDRGTTTVKNLETGEQGEGPGGLDALAAWVRERL